VKREVALVVAVATAAAAVVGLAAGIGACDDGADDDALCVPAAAGAVDFAGVMGLAGQLPIGTSPEAVARRAEAFGLLAGAGLTTLRQDFLWAALEPAPGVFEFDDYDALVDDALAHGVRVTGLLVYGNTWASPGAPDYLRPPDDLADYAAYAGVTAAHFAGRVDDWEVWNEPNVYFFWMSTPGGDPPRYGEMLKAASTAIRAADPGATVILGGTLWHAQPFVALGSVEFLEALFDAHPDLADYFDAAAVHPYELYPPAFGPEASDVGEVPVPEQLARVRAVLDLNGAGARPLQVTEIGWPTWGNVSEPLQARWLVRAAILAAAAGALRFQVFTLYDAPPGSGRVPPEEHFGLVSYDVTPLDGILPTAKAAYSGLAVLSATLAGTVPVCANVAMLGEGSDDGAAGDAGAGAGGVGGGAAATGPVHAVRFERPDGTRRVTAVWHEEDPDQPVGEPFPRRALRALAGAVEARLVSFDGAQSVLDAAAPAHVLVPSPEPVYIVEWR
jgi:hypothetical protein